MSYTRCCPAHTFPRESCADCKPYQLTGLQRTYLESRREKITAADGPAFDMAADLDPDGLVRFRPATFSEQLERITAKWVYEDGPEQAIGDVDAA